MSDSKNNQKAYVLQAGEGLGSADVKASKVATGGLLTLIESKTSGGAPLHVHTHEDECFYVVEGGIIVRCGDEQYEVGERGFVFLPRGIPHAWDVIGETAIVLMITVPAMLEEFLHEYHSAENDGRDAVAEKYGIRFIKEDKG